MRFTSESAAGVVAPAHATDVSTRSKLTMPGTESFVTYCAASSAVLTNRRNVSAVKRASFHHLFPSSSPQPLIPNL
jgi:hypothetical protein